MLTCNFQNLFSITEKHGIKNSEWQETDLQLETVLKKFTDRKQGFPGLIYDKQLEAEIIEKSFHGKQIIILGIGGSALGTICIQYALTKNSHKEMIVLDNIDPDYISDISKKINYQNCHFLVISKSGETLETKCLLEYFKLEVEKKGLNPKDLFTLITEENDGYLRKLAKEGYPSLSIPKNVGGRFSVLSSVGMYPAALLGLDVKEFYRGAKEIDKQFKSLNPSENLPFQLAKAQFLLYKKNKNIHVMMPYSSKLKKFADWYKQLLGESIGKNESTGITPQAAVGATDQHSQNQLYNDGPNDKLITFITVKNFRTTLEVPKSNGLTFNRFITLAKQGTEQALTQRNRPNITIEIDKINEYSLGQLFYLFEASTSLLGELLDINAFDQPGVELSKKITKSLLQ